MALNSNIINAFRKSFELNCIELISNAYAVAFKEKKYELNWLENDFSELLGNYVNEGRLSLDKGITCKTENKLFIQVDNLTKGFADKLPRIDFIYTKHWKRQRFECFMEAKRLKEKDSGLKRAYINDGMDRFVSQKYPLGCMVGYLLEGCSNETVNGINTLLEKDKRNTETLNLKISKFHKIYYESEHTEIGTLKHLIFDFTNSSN
ncbi:hypothetical protein [Solitalea canadensis]|uniref:Restriction endonuclease n=1 Tax=Solitalea canadensis (strain ATCC 29591 / DSM 3403 / JCM 21819 / LMG 8368 / NBRC 15130 / NCIMB 12057 / USAM 9D) TaxID=929556 RepID=H8KLX1_SOLCM|nr:hypothetical protein [Solitalea canadensis]AFD08699.1 hypothetical protein Solca_3696 [Solitalea canadensis DSM 3403]